MKKISLFFIILLLTAVFLVGCNDQKTEKTVESKKQEEVEVVEETQDTQDTEETKEAKPTYPLTGTEVSEENNNRVIGIMIENSVHARPQSGLHQADLVYEVLSEGTITRFLAFFHSEQPKVIGPVRSAREYYILLNNGYNGVYVSAGGSPGAFKMIDNGLVDHISGLAYDGRYFKRSSARKAPHNMYTSYEEVVKAAEHANITLQKDVPALTFYSGADVTVEGDDAKRITINYGSETNTVAYEFDQELSRYKRYNGGQQTADLETDTPVLLDNIFIVEAAHKVIPGDKAGRREINLNSGGRGYLIQSGVVQNVEWENIDGRILPKGEGIGFVPGKTWINIVPSFDRVSITQ